MQKNVSGFTLVELLVVLLIVAILAAIAGPNLAEMVKRNRLRAQADSVLTVLNLARSEAVKRNASVIICKSSNGTSCTGNWADGWIVYADADDDEVLDSGEIVRVFAGLKGGDTFGTSITSSQIIYNADGSYSGTAGTIRICSSDQDTADSWSITLNVVGRPRISQTTTTCP